MKAVKKYYKLLVINTRDVMYNLMNVINPAVYYI